MMGRTHKKIGAVWGIALSGILPGILNYQLSLASVAVSVVAAMFVDADAASSEFNRKLIHDNPVVDLVEEAVERLEDLMEYITKLILTVGPGILILVKTDVIAAQVLQLLAGLPYVGGLGETALSFGIKLIGLVLVGFGIIPKKYFREIPVIGGIYKGVSGTFHKGAVIIKRSIVVLVYAGIGGVLMYYNYMHDGDPVLYACGVLLVITGTLPHRAFLHSPWAMVLYPAAVWYIGNIFNMSWLAGPFFVGYASHVLLSDMLTKEGIPLWYSFGKKKWVRVSLHLMSTGTSKGNKFEAVYVIITALAVLWFRGPEYIINGLTRVFG